MSDERLCDVSIMILAGCLTPDIDWLRQGGQAAWLAMICLPARVRKHRFIIIVLCRPSLSTYFDVKNSVKLRCVFFNFHITYNSYLIEYDLPATNSDVHGTVHLQI